MLDSHSHPRTLLCSCLFGPKTWFFGCVVSVSVWSQNLFVFSCVPVLWYNVGSSVTVFSTFFRKVHAEEFIFCGKKNALMLTWNSHPLRLRLNYE